MVATIPKEIVAARASRSEFEASLTFLTAMMPAGDAAMRETDIAIVGGGLAGSTAAAMLGRAGHDVVLVDPHASYPKDFRVRPCFDFRALTYYGEDPAERVAYVTLFPIGTTMRANLFVYRDMYDPWLRQMRQLPEATMFAAMPRLRSLLGEVEIADVKIRPVDLYVSKGFRQAGIVLVGDAFATSCPAAGTGCNKVFTDVERLCSFHVPRWLATPGMGRDKIAAFYDDEVKLASDKFSRDKAFYLRSVSIETGVTSRARRLAKFLGHAGKGMVREAGRRVSFQRPDGARKSVHTVVSAQLLDRQP
jgi:hypothetical protein